MTNLKQKLLEEYFRSELWEDLSPIQRDSIKLVFSQALDSMRQAVLEEVEEKIKKFRESKFTTECECGRTHEVWGSLIIEDVLSSLKELKEDSK